MAATPVAVEVWRGERVESRHRVRACVADPDGRRPAGPGRHRRARLPALGGQAVPGPGPGRERCRRRVRGRRRAELALACASHGGEPDHVALVEAWLGAPGPGRDGTRLRPARRPCTSRRPPPLLRAGTAPRRIHNNCSGKHAGMLAAALQLGAPTRGYELPHHAVQRHCAGALAALAGLDRLPEPGIDGCGLPNHPLPLRGLARAAATLADPGGQAPIRRAALTRIGAAMRAQPHMVAGTGRCCTALMALLPDVIAKTGAEGVYLAALAGARPRHRASRPRTARPAPPRRRSWPCWRIWVLWAARCRTACSDFGRRRLRNTAGSVVGQVRPGRRMAGPVSGPTVGVDEVGRGPLAGPVVVAAVILKRPIVGLADSKALSAAQRARARGHHPPRRPWSPWRRRRWPRSSG